MTFDFMIKTALLIGASTAVLTAIGFYALLLRTWWFRLTEDQRRLRNGSFAIYAGIIAGVNCVIATVIIAVIYAYAKSYYWNTIMQQY